MQLTQNYTHQQQQNRVLALSSEMRLSLDILRMPLWDLREYIISQFETNPMLDLEDSQSEIDEVPEYKEVCQDKAYKSNQAKTEAEFLDELFISDNSQNFRSMLLEQIGTMKLDKTLRTLCEFIINCLDDRGYFCFDLEEIATEFGYPLSSLALAHSIVQSLSPKGVGARSLQECLMLQLSNSSLYCPEIVSLVMNGLHLISETNYNGICRLLNCSMSDAIQYAEEIKALNPIPSRGYSTGKDISYVYPDATITVDEGQLYVEMNTAFVPKLLLNKTYMDILQTTSETELQGYLSEKLAEAKSLIYILGKRLSTLERIMQLVATRQIAFFRDGKSLRPLTLSDVANQLNLHVSTISRAVQNKYIYCNTGFLPLQRLFVCDNDLSGTLTRNMINTTIQQEDTLHPLSDEKIKVLLIEKGVEISRRTVTKYREFLGIPNAFERKKCQVNR